MRCNGRRFLRTSLSRLTSGTGTPRAELFPKRVSDVFFWAGPALARVRTYVYTNGSFDLCSQCDAVNDCCTKAVEVRRAGARAYDGDVQTKPNVRATRVSYDQKERGRWQGDGQCAHTLCTVPAHSRAAPPTID